MTTEYYQCHSCQETIGFEINETIEGETRNTDTDHEYCMTYAIGKIEAIVNHLIQCKFSKVKSPYGD